MFSESDVVDSSRAVIISGSDVKEVIADDASNDIAYILYRPEVTRAHSFIDTISPDLNTEHQADLPAMTTGFPDASVFGLENSYSRIVSENCKTTNQKGLVTGYDGVLYGTTCEGWFGNSGGPVFIMQHPRGGFEWVGVLTHTFEDIDRNPSVAVRNDAFGKYSSINYSSFTLQKKYNVAKAKIPKSNSTQPEVSAAPKKGPVFGARVLNSSSGQSGVDVVEVAVGSPAFDAGLREGHMITRIDSTVINSESDFASAIDSAIAAKKRTIRVEAGASGSADVRLNF